VILIIKHPARSNANFTQLPAAPSQYVTEQRTSKEAISSQ